MKEGESRTYIVPLRQGWIKIARWKRTERAIRELQKFLLKHTKAKSVALSRWINDAIWAHGGKNPPGKITITVKLEKDVARAELAQLPPKAKRVAEVAKVKRKKKEEEKKAKEEEKKKVEEYKKQKEEEKKKLYEAKQQYAKMTPQQEMLSK